MKNTNTTNIIDNLFQYSSDLCCILDGNKNFLKTNPNLENTFGYKETDLLGSSFFGLVVKEDISITKQIIDNLIDKQETAIFSCSMKKKEGNYCRFNWRFFITDNTIFGTGSAALIPNKEITNRHKEYEALNETFELFKISIDNANDAVFWLNKKGGFEYVNDIAWKTLGYSKDELLLLSVMDIDIDTTQSEYDERWRSYQKYKNKGSYNTKFESRYKRKDGSLFPVEISVTHFWRNDREYHIKHIRDISKSKKEEKLLRQSEEKYKQLFIHMSSAFSLQKPIYNKEGNAVDYIILEANPALEKNTGKKAKEIIGKHAKEIFPNTENYWIQLFGEVAKTGLPQKKTDYSKETDSYFDIYAFSPKKGFCATIFNDVTDRVKNEFALRTSEEKYRLLFENMTSSFALHKIIYNKDNKPIDFIYEEVNPVFEKYAGLSAHDVIGKKAKELHPDMEDYWVEFFGEVATTGKPKTIVQYSKELDKYFEAYAFCTKKGYCAAIFNDVTVRVQNQEALKHNEEKYRLLFTNLPNSFSIYKVIFNKEGDPVNYQFSEVNPACERDLGLSAENLIGKLVTEVFPETESYWIEIFGKVVKTGKSFKYTNYSAELDRHYEAIIYAQSEDHCAVIFNDITDRIKNEEGLKKFKTSIDNSLDGVFWINKDAKFEYVNKTACSMLGYTHDELIKLSLYDIDPEAKKDDFNSLWENLVQNMDFKSFTNERTHRRKDGSIFPVELNTSFLLEKNNGILISYAKDISERKKQEASLRASEERARLFVENAPVAIAMFDTNMQYLIASKNYNKTFKLGNINLIGQCHYDVFPEIPEDWKEEHKQALNGKITKCDKVKFNRQDGSIQWLRYEVHPWNKSENTIGGVLIFSEDITEKIETSEALKESELKMQRLFEVAPIGLGIVKNRSIIDLNTQISKITGYSEEELKGAETKILYPSIKEYNRVGNILYREIETKRTAKTEAIWKRKDGQLINVLMAITLVDPNNPSKGAISMIMDITERKNYEAALEQQVLALTRPLDEIGNIKFTDLFNIDELQKLQDTISKATGVASIITYPDGTPITKPSNFTKLCQLIRSTKKGNETCMKSDALIGKYSPNQVNTHPCLNAGLWDASANITLGGVHIANWLVGQTRNEKMNEEEIIKYAHQLDVSEDEFRKAQTDIKIMSKEKFETITDAFHLLANEISIKSYQNFQQARFIAEEKATKEILLKNQKLLEESQRIAKMGSWEIDLEKNKLIWNKEAFQVHGYDYRKIEPTLDLFLNQVHPEDKAYMQTHLATSIKNKSVTDIECRIITPDGMIKHVLIAGEVLSDDTKANKLYGIIQDITQQKNNEAQIIKEKEKAKESEERFRALHNASFGGIAIHDKGVILDCNRGLSEISGYTYAELIGMDGLLLIAEDSRNLVRDNIKKGFEQSYEAMGLRKNGESYPMHVEARNIPYKGKQVRSVEFRDITTQKQIEAEIVKEKNRAEENEYFLKETQRVGNIGSYKFFYKEHYWISTEIFDQIFGFDAADKRPYDQWIASIHPADKDEIVNEYNTTVLEKKLPFDREYRIIRKNTHEIKWIHSYGKAYLDDEGNIETILGTVQDITERKLVEEHRRRINTILEHKVNERTAQLQQANKDLESFAYSVSHDLRAPIRHIDGFLQLLRKNIEPTEPKVASYIGKINQASKGMSIMIDELLKFSRLGRTEIQLKDVDLNNIIKDIINRFKPDYENRIIEWKIEDIGHVSGDSSLLRIVMENILSNAIKYTSKKEIAIIEVKEYKSDDNSLTFMVKDNGAGFDMAYKDKLFGVFQRLHKKEDFEGIGIGLANVKQILEKHNGKIDVDAIPDKGATFYITLPK